MGGDEFLVLVPHQPLAATAEWAERFRAAVADHPFVHDGLTLKLSVSIGLAERALGVRTPDTLPDAADALLHTAKYAGRNTARRPA